MICRVHRDSIVDARSRVFNLSLETRIRNLLSDVQRSIDIGRQRISVAEKNPSRGGILWQQREGMEPFELVHQGFGFVEQVQLTQTVDLRKEERRMGEGLTMVVVTFAILGEVCSKTNRASSRRAE